MSRSTFSLKHISVSLPESSFDSLIQYLFENHYSNAVSGFTLSFGSWSCEARCTSEYLYSLKELKK